MQPSSMPISVQRASTAKHLFETPGISKDVAAEYGQAFGVEAVFHSELALSGAIA